MATWGDGIAFLHRQGNPFVPLKVKRSNPRLALVLNAPIAHHLLDQILHPREGSNILLTWVHARMGVFIVRGLCIGLEVMKTSRKTFRTYSGHS